MTDLEATKLCAEAMGLKMYFPYAAHPYIEHSTHFDRDTSLHGVSLKEYWPITNDAQAMALLKRFDLCVFGQERHTLRIIAHWRDIKGALHEPDMWDADLNRAIVYCVAQMQQARAVK